MGRKMFIVLSTAAFLLCINTAGFAMMCGSHSGNKKTAQVHTGHEHHKAAETTTEQEVAKGAVNVENKICPVSGENIDERLKATYEYKGRVYNFCCPMCIEDFKKDPDKYIKKVNEGLQTESKSEINAPQRNQEETGSVRSIHGGHGH